MLRQINFETHISKNNFDIVWSCIVALIDGSPLSFERLIVDFFDHIEPPLN